MRLMKMMSLVVLLTLCAHVLDAGDVYVFRFLAYGPAVGCGGVQWLDDVLFFNHNDGVATVSLLGISNGGVPPLTPTSISIPARRALSLNTATTRTPWRPSPVSGATIAVARLEVPTGVSLTSRDEVFLVSAPCPVVQPFRFSLGTVPLPIYRQLTPPNVSRAYLGTDLGDRDVRVNIALYNDSDLWATARMELRRVCDDSLDDSATILIPPKSALQYGSLHKGADACVPVEPFTAPYLRYTVVTVDQPSLSYVSVLGPASTVDDLHLAPILELAVPLGTEVEPNF